MSRLLSIDEEREDEMQLCLTQSQERQTSERAQNNFTRAKQFRRERRRFRKSKAYIYLKLAFVAVVLAAFAALVGIKAHLHNNDDGEFLERSRRNTGEDVAPWEECDFEIETDARRAGFIILWLFLIVWVFIGLAVICDDFFVPSLEQISEKLKLTEDVAGATFMAAGSSAPELFTSIAGVSFESDVGVGTIVGSAIFNLLIIIALSAALSLKTLNLDWRPLARDSAFYALSIVMFICFAWDAELRLWECGCLFFAYCVYVSVMFVNKPLMRFLAFISNCFQSNDVPEIEDKPEKEEKKDGDGDEDDDDGGIVLIECLPAVLISVPKKESSSALHTAKFIGEWILFCLAFPWCLLFAWTVPNCGKNHLSKYFITSFIMSVFWIAVCSFAMVFMVGRCGCAMTIDPFVMGLILVAIGTSVPDAISSVIVAREGFGDMAVSNAIGSNVFDINLGIGLPSVIRIIADKGNVIHLIEKAELDAKQDKYPNNPFIPHVKFGFLLLFVLIVCIGIFTIVRFRLNRVVGFTFCIMYAIFIVYAVIQEFACDKGFAC